MVEIVRKTCVLVSLVFLVKGTPEVDWGAQNRLSQQT